MEGGPRLDFRDMSEADLAHALRLSRASGWNQTLEDWRLLLSLGPGLFRVATLDDRVVASGGAVRYGDAFAWICMILVEPQARGHGLGTRIFDEVLDRVKRLLEAGAIRSVGLDATPAGRGIYVQRSFVDGPEIVRMRREPSAVGPRPLTVRPLKPADLELVLARDLEVFGADRGRLLRSTLEEAPELAWVACAEPGRAAGYCFGRPGDHSAQVGPVVAEDRATALDLVRAAAAETRGRPLVLDARAEPPWLESLGALGFRVARPFTRMYLGDTRPPAQPALEPAVFGPEFG